MGELILYWSFEILKDELFLQTGSWKENFIFAETNTMVNFSAITIPRGRPSNLYEMTGF